MSDLMTAYYAARKAILDHVGCVEGWTVLPFDDVREMWWTISDSQVHYAPTKAQVEKYLVDADDSGKFYSHALIYVQHAIFRGAELAVVLVDTYTDGNKFMQIFRIDREIPYKDLP